MLFSDECPTGDLDDAVQLDPEVLQARAIFDVARTRLLASVSGSREAIDLTEAQRLLDALTTARLLAEDAEDRVLRQRGLLTAAEAERRAIARRPAACRPAIRPAANPTDSADSADSARRADATGAVVATDPEASVHRPVPGSAASVVLRAVLPAAAALAGAAAARRLRQR